MKTIYTSGQKIEATCSTATGIITYADKRVINWRWDHDTSQEWSATPKEFADLAAVIPQISKVAEFLNTIYKRNNPAPIYTETDSLHTLEEVK